MQFVDRAVPEVDAVEPSTAVGAAEPECESNKASALLYGAGPLSWLRARCLHACKVGIKAALVCDFYMTKYHAKAQQVLCRCAEEEHQQEEPQTLPERALKRLRRLMFAANRCLWLSAAEFAIFALTGGHRIQTHGGLPLFTSRAHFGSQGRKQLLNNEDLGAGSASAVRPEPVNALLVRVGDGHPRQDKHELQSQAGEDAPPDDDLPQPEVLELQSQAGDDAPPDEFSRSEELGLQSQAGEDEAPDDDASLPEEPELQSQAEGDAELAVKRTRYDSTDKGEDEEPPVPSALHVLPATSTIIDDWLHRGPHLADLDLYDCSIGIGRVRATFELLSNQRK